MTEKAARSCANCHYYRDTVCAAPLPLSFVGIHFRRRVKAESGTQCPAHRMKVVRKTSAIQSEGASQ